MGIRALRRSHAFCSVAGIVPVEGMSFSDLSQCFSECLQSGEKSHIDFKTEETAPGSCVELGDPAEP